MNMGLVKYLRNVIHHDSSTRRRLDQGLRKLEELQSLVVENRLLDRIERIRERTLHSCEQGVSEKRLCETDVVVSLTSFGNRVSDVHLAIETIMQGTIKPNRIILWLSESEFSSRDIPVTLQRQVTRGLEIRFCKDIRSYTKLMYTLKEYPDSCIITIDDDVIYEYDIVERLINTHKHHPQAVCACRVHRIILGNDNKPKSYMDWDWEVESQGNENPLLFPTGVGGVLYPPHCFSDEVFNEDIYMTKCPYADDVWFYAMELLNGTPVVQVYTGMPTGYYSELPSSHYNSLRHQNTNAVCCRNDVQIKAVFDHYDLYKKLC